MMYKELVNYSQRLKFVSSRNEKIGLVVDFLKKLAPEEGKIGVNYIAEIIKQGRINVKYSAIQSVIDVGWTGGQSPDLLTIDCVILGVEWVWKVVVEIAFNEVQRSPKYDSGYALRFARIKRIRSDKTSGEINTILDLERYARIKR